MLLRRCYPRWQAAPCAPRPADGALGSAIAWVILNWCFVVGSQAAPEQHCATVLARCKRVSFASDFSAPSFTLKGFSYSQCCKHNSIASAHGGPTLYSRGDHVRETGCSSSGQLLSSSGPNIGLGLGIEFCAFLLASDIPRIQGTLTSLCLFLVYIAVDKRKSRCSSSS